MASATVSLPATPRVKMRLMHLPCSRLADGNDERCVIQAVTNVYASASQYAVEFCCDYLTIGSTQYKGQASAPFNVYMAAGTTALWTSDYSVTSGGFTLCATRSPLPYPAPSMPPAPPPPFPPFSPGMFTILSGALEIHQVAEKQAKYYENHLHETPGLAECPCIASLGAVLHHRDGVCHGCTHHKS